MNRIDLYVSEVGQHLPARMRADLEAEIRSLIQDTLDERSAAAGRPVDDEMMVDVLRTFGPPAKMAASYLPPRYLIGPRLFPTFLMVMRILLSVLGVIALVRLGVEFSQPGLTFTSGLEIFAQNLATFMTSVFAALGNVVFVFAIIEWFQLKETAPDKPWDPRTLKPRSETEQVNRVAVAWGMAMTILALVVFNVYPDWIGVLYYQDGQWQRLPAPLLTEAFWRFLPVLNLIWALQLGLSMLLLQAGRWTNSTRWFQIGIKVINMVILVMMISGPAIINLSVSGVPGLEPLRDLQPVANYGIRALLTLVLVLEGFEIARLLYRLMNRTPLPVITNE